MRNETTKMTDRSKWVWSRVYTLAMAHYGSSLAAAQAAREAVAAYRARRNGGAS